MVYALCFILDFVDSTAFSVWMKDLERIQAVMFNLPREIQRRQQSAETVPAVVGLCYPSETEHAQKELKTVTWWDQ